METKDKFHHLPMLKKVADHDTAFLQAKDRSYGASWKASGGRSAWFMLVRKMDRLRALMSAPLWPEGFSLDDLKALTLDEVPNTLTPELAGWLVEALTAEDIFAKIEGDPGGGDGSVLAEVRDLRRYLLLVEAEMVARLGTELLDDHYLSVDLVKGSGGKTVLAEGSVPVEDSNRHGEREAIVPLFWDTTMIRPEWANCFSEAPTPHDGPVIKFARLEEIVAEIPRNGPRQVHTLPKWNGQQVYVVLYSSPGFAYLDRSMVRPSDRDQLKSYQRELNTKEYNDTTYWVRSLYVYRGDLGEGKYVIRQDLVDVGY